MKHLLLTTIAAVVLVGCGVPSVDIWTAAKEGNIEAVKYHLAAGVDVNAPDMIKRTPLDHAASEGHKAIAELLIAKGADVNGMVLDIFNPLFSALTRGHKEIVELLIAEGVDVNMKIMNGTTPLHFADWLQRDTAIVELLIAKGADVNAMNNDGETTLDFAIKFNRTGTADLLRKHGGKTGEELKGGEPVVEATQPELPTAEAPDISIHDAAKEGNIEAVKQFIAAGKDVNAKDDLYGTPLHLAAEMGHKEIAELLIAKGADVNAKDNIGWTPLHFATVLDHKEIVELLIAAGADVNAKNKEGRAPLDWADGETANLLRKHGGKTGAELKAAGN